MMSYEYVKKRNRERERKIDSKAEKKDVTIFTRNKIQ